MIVAQFRISLVFMPALILSLFYSQFCMNQITCLYWTPIRKFPMEVHFLICCHVCVSSEKEREISTLQLLSWGIYFNSWKIDCGQWNYQGDVKIITESIIQQTYILLKFIEMDSLNLLSQGVVTSIQRENDDRQTSGTSGLYPKVSRQVGSHLFRFPGSTESRSKLTTGGVPSQMFLDTCW